MRQTGSFDREAVRSISAAKLVLGVEGRQSGPRAVRAAPVRVAKSTDEVGALLVGDGEGVAQNQAALGVGVADLDGDALAAASMSPGRKAAPEIAFSTAGMRTPQAHGQLRAMTIWRRRSACRGAAHVLLHQQHGGGGLDVEATGVEGRPPCRRGSPWARSLRPISVDQAGRPAAARPTAWIIGRFSAAGRRRRCSLKAAPCASASCAGGASISAGPSRWRAC